MLSWAEFFCLERQSINMIYGFIYLLHLYPALLHPQVLQGGLHTSLINTILQNEKAWNKNT